MCDQLASKMDKSENFTSSDKHKEAYETDENFTFDENDDFYMAPAVCKLLHYRTAAAICGVLEVLVLIFVVLSFFSLQLDRGLTKVWLSVVVVVVLIFATFTTCLMLYGIVTERPSYLWPQMRFMRVEICLLLMCATVAILSMSLGLDATYRFFGAFLNVHEMENHFGPIWPFNIAVLSFFGAFVTNWFHIITRGAYDFYMDKECFKRKPHIEMVNRD